MTPRNLLIGCGGLVILVVVFILGVALASNVHISFGPQTTIATGTTPTVATGNTPVGTTPLPTQPPPQVTPQATPQVTQGGSGGGPTNGNGQDFTATSAPITGPAIVEWYGDASCGTFKLPSGQTFSWQRNSGGHFWTYATDADVDAAWSAHVTAFNNNSFNQQHACQVDVRP